MGSTGRSYPTPVTTDEIILHEILLELRELKMALHVLNVPQINIPSTSTDIKPQDAMVTTTATGTGYAIVCKYCGGTHENKGQIMACAKKAKRKEGN